MKNRGHLGSRYIHPKGQNPKKPMKQTKQQNQSKTQGEIGSGLSVEMDSVGKDGKDNIHFCIISIRYIRICYIFSLLYYIKKLCFRCVISCGKRMSQGRQWKFLSETQQRHLPASGFEIPSSLMANT